ncbi:AraC family transcriptional regulator [Phenylobacterium terrae]|uniref:AraC family transcriptional regulator n=1 Tax=Phenylobacterium terrae TaxID=2665495 RepID=A0ABW4N215_9CAUL
MPEATVAAGYPKALLDFAATRGVSKTTLLETSRIDPADLCSQDNRAPLGGYLAMLDLAVSLSGDPAFALKFGEGVRMQDLSIVGLIGQTAETTGEASEQIARYARLVFDETGDGATRLSGVVREGGRVWIAHPGPQDSPHFAEASLARSVTGARALLATTPYFQAGRFPRAVHFVHAAPPHAGEYERIFRAPVVFGSDRNALLVDDEFLSIRLPTSSRYVFGIFSDRAEALLNELETAISMRGRVEAILMPILHKGEVRMAKVAGALGMSRQTLHRRLKSEGVSFELVLDDLRRRMAISYLTRRKVSVNEAAYLVGFSDPAAFSRAFKRWTGQPPSSLLRER